MKLIFLYTSILLLSFTSLNAQIMLPAYQAAQYTKGGLIVTTTAITNNTTGNTATSGGTIVGIGTVTARGVVWSTTTEPTTALTTKTNNGTGTTAFTSALTALSPGTTYYVRAYATVVGTTIYGNEVTFTSAATSTFYTTGNLQYFTVPAGVTSVTIEAVGGDGAQSFDGAFLALGGIGATIKGTFAVTAGSILELLVGAGGITSIYSSTSGGGGGGGGSWVLRSGTLLLVAGGGGGGAVSLQYGNAKGGNAVVSTGGSSGTTGTGGSLTNPAVVNTGGSSGNGGFSGTDTGYYGGNGPGGGGGWLTTGGGAVGFGTAYPGAASVTMPWGNLGIIMGGGYGGGGGGLASANDQAAAGGGGGGYSGGGGSTLPLSGNQFRGSASGGGGGSYNVGTNPVNIAGSSHPQPYIKITW